MVQSSVTNSETNNSDYIIYCLTGDLLNIISCLQQ